MSISIEVNVDISDILSQSNRDEKRWLLRKLLNKMPNDDIIDCVSAAVSDNHKQLVRHYFGSSSVSDASANEREFQENVLKISRNYLTLTKEEEELLAKIAKRF